MPWQARTSADRRYVEILYSGRVTPDELQAAFDRAMELSRSLERPWFFADCTGRRFEQQLAEVGAQVEYLPYTLHTSTTKLRRRIESA